ncbi:MAG: hypothetical protein ACI4WS_02805, partial [Oscillospiraceae bacterium]
ISSFIVMNVVVGIVVNSISEVTTENNNKEDEDTAEEETGDLASEIKALKEHIEKLETLLEKQKTGS